MNDLGVRGKRIARTVHPCSSYPAATLQSKKRCVFLPAYSATQSYNLVTLRKKLKSINKTGILPSLDIHAVRLVLTTFPVLKRQLEDVIVSSVGSLPSESSLLTHAACLQQQILQGKPSYFIH